MRPRQDNLIAIRTRMNKAYSKYSKTPANRRILAVAFLSIGVTLILLFTLLFGFDSIAEKTQLLMEGFAGLFAIISVIFTAVFFYRTHSAYWNNRKY